MIVSRFIYFFGTKFGIQPVQSITAFVEANLKMHSSSQSVKIFITVISQFLQTFYSLRKTMAYFFSHRVDVSSKCRRQYLRQLPVFYQHQHGMHKNWLYINAQMTTTMMGKVFTTQKLEWNHFCCIQEMSVIFYCVTCACTVHFALLCWQGTSSSPCIANSTIMCPTGSVDWFRS